MNKQQFISMSLHSALICEVKEIGLIKPKISRIVMAGTNCCVPMNMSVSVEVAYGQVKPILHPLSDLIKEIEVNGEKFVPLVELAKIAEFIPNGIDEEFNDLCLCNNYTVSFFYGKESFTAGRINYKENDWIEDLSVPNQLQLFQKLIEWHFDIAGLIEKGEAIDVNTLEINPYL